MSNYNNSYNNYGSNNNNVFKKTSLCVVFSGLNDGEPIPPKILDMIFELLEKHKMNVLGVDTISETYLVYEFIVDKEIPRYLTYVPSGWDLGDWTIYSGNLEIPLYYTDDNRNCLSFFPRWKGGYNTYFQNLDKVCPKITVEEKMKFMVFTTEKHAFLKMPNDKQFIRREGIDMQHCLAVCQDSYCDRMEKGEIALYSMINKETGEAKVDIEVALEIPSYNRVKVSEPSVTQIRGPKNQCPPDDALLPELMEFFDTYGEAQGWLVAGHGYKNFDNRVDGDLLYTRCAVLGI